MDSYFGLFGPRQYGLTNKQAHIPSEDENTNESVKLEGCGLNDNQ